MIDVIIIGAGAAGLMAGKLLAAKGLRVQILEARDRIGGRIFSLPPNQWGYAAEGGAEFVHGNLPHSLALLQEARQQKNRVQGQMWQVVDGNWEPAENEVEYEELVKNKLQQLKHDMTMATFLEQEFGGPQYARLRQSLLGYVEGYYSGDANRTSAKTFLTEWMSEDEEQYRPAGGYMPLMNFMAQAVTSLGGQITLDCVVKNVEWRTHWVQVTDSKGGRWQAKQLINTIPLGVWTAEEDAAAAINYQPALLQKTEMAGQMGFGSVIKILVRFTHSFYQRLMHGREDTGFIFSDAEVPTWWTQYPLDVPVLTGWLAGPRALACSKLGNEEIYQVALRSLAAIFTLQKDVLTKAIQQHEVFNWSADPYTRGAYAYSTPQSKTARAHMAKPVNDTLFFAGEALYEGTETGTVEAALTSGIAVAGQIFLSNK